MEPSTAEPVDARTVAPHADKPTVGKNIAFVAKGGSVTFAGKMFLSAVRVVTAVILTRLLQADQFGLYSLALSAANIGVAVAVFGLDAALVRYVAVLSSRKDDAELWGALQVSVGTAMLFSLATGVALYLLASPIANTVFNEPALTPLLQLVSIIIPVLALSELLAGAIRGFKRMDFAAAAQFVAQPVIRLILIIILAVGGLSVVEAIATFVLADLAASFILVYFVNKEFSLHRSLRDAHRNTKAILNYSLPVWLSNLMVNFHKNFQSLVLGSLNTMTSVGIFTVASQVTEVSSQFSSSINVSAKPVIAELHDRDDVPEMGRIYQTANRWVTMVQLPVFLITVLFPEQILSIFGQSFTDGTTALIIMAVSSLVLVATGMGGIIIDMTGYTKLKLLNSIVRLVLYVAMDFLLIPRWGVVGAAMAALIGEGAANLLRLVQVYILFRIIPYNRSFLRILLAAGAGLAGSLLVSTWLPPDTSLLFAAIDAAVLLVIYGLLILSIGFSIEERGMVTLGMERILVPLVRRFNT